MLFRSFLAEPALDETHIGGVELAAGEQREGGRAVVRLRAEKDARLFAAPVCPVATSATLGDGNDPARVLDFARDVFGLTLSDDAVILETRTDLDTWVQPHREATKAMGLNSRAGQQRPGVRMPGIIKDLICHACLNDFSRIHHRHTVCSAGHDPDRKTHV